MCHSRNLNNKINRTKERALQIVYEEYRSSLKKYLEKDNTVSIHLQYLVTEINIVKNGTSPMIINEIFEFRENPIYKLRSGNHLERPYINTMHFGTKSIVSLSIYLFIYLFIYFLLVKPTVRLYNVLFIFFIY